MSLAVLADHMASKGRGGDSMLIHMAPSEIRGLQALAVANGSSLTINPETGLPEALSLKKLLPAIIGFGITAMTGIPAWQVGLGVGAVETARTGDLGRGISAGLGAYGGAGMGAGFSTAGAETIGSQAAGQSYLASAPGVLEGAGAGLSADMAANLTNAGVTDTVASSAAQQAAAERIAAASPFDKLSAGFDAAKANPSSLLTKDNFKYMAAAAAPVLADQAVKSNMPTTTTKPGMIRPYSFDPYGGGYVAANSYEAAPTRAAEGGLMGMNSGGYNPGQLDFTQKSEPVVRMAGGGVSDADVKNWFLANPGATDSDIKSAMSTYGVDLDQIARATGTQDRMDEYTQRLSAVAEPAPVAPVYEEPTYTPAATSVYSPEPEPEAAYTPTAYTPTAYTPTSVASYVPSQAAIEPEDTYVAPAGIEALAATLPTAAPVTPKVTDEQIQTWWSDPAHQKLNDAQIKQVMLDNSVTPEQFANAIGANADTSADIVSRYEAALKPPADTIPVTSAASAPVVTAPVTSAPVVTAPETGGGLAALSTAPAYNKYTNEEIAKYLVDNPTVDIAKAIKETKADPAAVNAYIASIADPFRGSTDTTGGSGVLGIYNQMKAQGVDPNELYAAELANDPKYAGYTQPMIQKAYDLSKGAYALSDQLKGNVSDKNWVKYMDDNKYSIDDAAQAFGLSRNEVRDRYNAVKDAEKKVIPITPPTKIDPDTKTTRVTAPTDIITAPSTVLSPGVSGATGPSVVGGGTTVNPNGTITTSPRIPGIPAGGFTGVGDVRTAYTQGGGSLGYTPYVPKTIADFESKYNTLTGGSKSAYDYLTGKTPYSPKPYTPTGEVMKPYAESVLGMPANASKKMYLFDPATQQYKINPDYAIPTYDAKGNKVYNVTNKDVITQMAAKPSASDFYAWAKANNLTVEQIAAATGMPITEVQKLFSGGAPADTSTAGASGKTSTEDMSYQVAKKGGLMAMAGGGMSQQFDLGGYSDGGRLLRGPGDGVSDSIPATIGNKRPARLADGEFVVPARIVSELGNGSTEAGARKLYAMMDRVQSARRSSIGKGKVAKNSRADKHLPA
jgi:hypothetical protein